MKKGSLTMLLGLCVSILYTIPIFAGIYTYDPAVAVTSDQAFREMAECGQWHMDYDGDWEGVYFRCSKLPYSFLGVSCGCTCSYESGSDIVSVEMIVPEGCSFQEEVRHHFEAEEYVDATARQTEGMNQAEKVRWIHDFVCNLVDYDYEGLERYNSGQGEMNYSVYDAFTSHKVVCEGYSRTFWAIAGAAGLPVRIVSGTIDGREHAWNEVFLDGAWKCVDCTWDDSQAGIRYKYFLTDITYDNSWAQ